MNGFIFLTSPYLFYPNVLVGLEFHFFRKRFIIDELCFSQDSFVDPVHIRDSELIQAIKKYIQKDCKNVSIYFANEETGDVELL